jgi:hypothetical protein
MLSHDCVSTCTTSVFFWGGGEFLTFGRPHKKSSASHQRNFVKKLGETAQIGMIIFSPYLDNRF